jgi:hypothetical protein
MGKRLKQRLRLVTKGILGTVLALALLTAVTLTLSGPLREPGAFPGYTLLAPLLSTRTYLIDMQGRVVHAWDSDYAAGQAAYLLEDGHLLRAGQLLMDERLIAGPAAGGRVQEFTWDGGLVWDFKFHNEKQVPHHDLARLPNGNVLLIVWEIKTAEETIAAGRNPESVDGPWLVDSLVEIRPTGKTTGEVVWEWHCWDHLIQDRDPSRANYGDVAAHPERIDVNYGRSLASEMADAARSDEEAARKKKDGQILGSIGYLGSPAPRGNPGGMPDWTHINAVAYNAELDQVMLTVRAFSEFWIIDHSTTSAEAAGHTGGRSGQGGDILHRWGNPRAYRAGGAEDQRLFAPHDAHWIPRGRPGAGHVLVFNNGSGRPGGDYSSVDEIVLPVDAQGRYAREPGAAYGPEQPDWRFTARDKKDFSAGFLSGAQRLSNGNTLICHGLEGVVFEVTPGGQVVWTYTCAGAVLPGPKGSGGLPQLQDLLAAYMKDMLKLSPAQQEELDELRRQVASELDRTLTGEQKGRLKERSGLEPIGLGGVALSGRLLSVPTRILLKVTKEQEKGLTELQKAVLDKLDKVLTIEQKAELGKLKADFNRGWPSGFTLDGPPGVGPGRSGGGPGSGLAGSGVSRGMNPVFRAYRYGMDDPGLAGKDLRPDRSVTELRSNELKR